MAFQVFRGQSQPAKRLPAGHPLLSPLKLIAELANSGTLCAFVAVALAMMIYRRTNPARPRIFRVPLWWLVGPAAILGCLYLFWSLPALTQRLFFFWNAAGMAVYALYGVRKSRLRDIR